MQYIKQRHKRERKMNKPVTSAESAVIHILPPEAPPLLTVAFSPLYKIQCVLVYNEYIF